MIGLWISRLQCFLQGHAPYTRVPNAYWKLYENDWHALHDCSRCGWTCEPLGAVIYFAWEAPAPSNALALCEHELKEGGTDGALRRTGAGSASRD